MGEICCRDLRFFEEWFKDMVGDFWYSGVCGIGIWLSSVLDVWF